MVGLAIILIAVAVALAGAVMFWIRGARRVGTPPQRATYEALHTATLAVSALRDALTPGSASKAAPALRQLLGTPAVAICDQSRLIAYEGSQRHADALQRCLNEGVPSGRSQILSAAALG